MPALATPPAPAPAVTAAVAYTVDSVLLGPVVADADAVYTFPDGIYGFERARTFVLVPSGRDGLCWLQSLEDGTLVLLLADPAHFYPDEITGAPDLDAAARVVVTLPRAAGGTATANLQAPVLLHTATRAGRQVVLDDGRQRVRVPIAIG